MDWKNALHSKALVAAGNFKEAEKALQGVLREIDQHKVYYDLGFRSLMDYAISGLGLTSDVAYNHCTVVKRSQDLPEIRKAVSEGIVSVSAVRHMAPVLTKENQKEMIELGRSLTQRELRKEIARRNPEISEMPEKARYVREDRLALELRVSEDLMKKLRRAQDLVSQSQRKLCSLEETLEGMVEVFLEKRDPLKKAERAQNRNPDRAEVRATPTEYVRRIIRKNEIFPMKSNKAQIPAVVRHAVMSHLNGRCSYQDASGKRCDQTRWLHFHHITPLSEGGEHSTKNLTLLCSGHHRMIHRISRTAPNSRPAQVELSF